MNAMSPALRGEFGRKAVHMALLLLPVWTYAAPAPWQLRGLLLALAVGAGLDLLRLFWRPLGRRVTPLLAPYLRPGEARAPIRGAHALTLCAVLLAWSVRRDVAATALAYAVVGDAAAALVGRAWGRHRFGRKSLEGSLACFVCCSALGAVLLAGHPAAVVGGALVATLVEAAPLPVDDNLGVPLVSAVALLGLVALM